LCARRIDFLWTGVSDSPPDDAVAWAQRFIDLHDRGVLRPADYAPFFATAIRHELTIRDEVRLRDDAPPIVPMIRTRTAIPEGSHQQGVGWTPSVTWGYDDAHIALRINGIENPHPGYEQQATSAGRMLRDMPARTNVGGRGFHNDPMRWREAGVMPGEATIEIDVRRVVHLDTNPSSPELDDSVVTVRATTTVLPFDDAPPDRLTDDIDRARAVLPYLHVWASAGRLELSPTFPERTRVGFHVVPVNDGVPNEDHPHTYEQEPFAPAGRDASGPPHVSGGWNFSSFRWHWQAGDTIDLLLRPNPDTFLDEAEPDILGFGVLFEGVPVQAGAKAWNEKFYPRPERLLLVDRDGEVIEELAFPSDGWWAPASADDTPE
jgi:hypothetical protein